MRPPEEHEIDLSEIAGLLAFFDRGGWQELTVDDGPDRLRLVRSAPARQRAVRSPSVGRWFAAVNPGSRVQAGAELGRLVIADRTEQILAPAGGRIGDRLVPDGAHVEYGDELVVLTEKEHGRGRG